MLGRPQCMLSEKINLSLQLSYFKKKALFAIMRMCLKTTDGSVNMFC